MVASRAAWPTAGSASPRWSFWPLFAPGEAALEHAWIYLLAFVAQLVGDWIWTYVRDLLLDRLPFKELAAGWFGTARVDAIFAPLALLVTIVAVDDPIALLAIAPLTWLFHSFADDREERYAKTLELHRAYRGTVMLLSDVVESEDRLHRSTLALGGGARKRRGRRAGGAT